LGLWGELKKIYNIIEVLPVRAIKKGKPGFTFFIYLFYASLLESAGF
jgi:hypothetical protein